MKRRWFVWIDDKVYGPYIERALAGFIKSETWVCPEGEKTWQLAREVSELAHLLDGEVEEPLDWFVRTSAGVEKGPFTRKALLRLMDRKEVGPSDKVRHESWDIFHPLSETKLYHRHLSGEYDLSRFSPGEILMDGETSPGRGGIGRNEMGRGGRGGRGKGVRSGMDDAEEKDRFGRLHIAIIILFSMGLLFYIWRGLSPSPTPPDLHPVVVGCGGLPDAPCTRSEVSRCICNDLPRLCGCASTDTGWGLCGMESCLRYKEIRENPPPAASINNNPRRAPRGTREEGEEREE